MLCSLLFTGRGIKVLVVLVVVRTSPDLRDVGMKAGSICAVAGGARDLPRCRQERNLFARVVRVSTIRRPAPIEFISSNRVGALVGAECRVGAL